MKTKKAQGRQQFNGLLATLPQDAHNIEVTASPYAKMYAAGTKPRNHANYGVIIAHINAIGQGVAVIAYEKCAASCENRCGFYNARNAANGYLSHCATNCEGRKRVRKKSAKVSLNKALKDNARITLEKIVKGDSELFDAYSLDETQKKEWQAEAQAVLDSKSEDKLVSIALNTTPVRKDPNDKISNLFFTMTDDELEYRSMSLLEGVKKGEELVSYISFDWDKAVEHFPVLEKFDAFDREVVLACISEYVTHSKGNYTQPVMTTFDAVYRAMIGDEGNGKNAKHPSKRMLEKIKHSIDKARLCSLTIDLSAVCRAYGYNGGKPAKLTGYLLPAKYMEGVMVNGKATTVLKLYELSPLFEAAEIKNGQILAYDKKLLAVPNVKNTEDTIVIKNLLVRRLLAITGHKELKPKLLIESIFQDAELADLSRTEKNRLIKQIENMFDYWLEIKKIKSYSLLDPKDNFIRGAKWQDSKIVRPTPQNAKAGIRSIIFEY